MDGFSRPPPLYHGNSQNVSPQQFRSLLAPNLVWVRTLVMGC
jgi:hypothetical protein